jgi:nitrogen fixation protein FixH
MNWGKGIFITFVVFALGLVVMLVITLRQDLGLVASDYYKQELAYQDQMERIKNFNSLVNKPEIKQEIELNKVVLTFPSELLDQIHEGEVQFFRPSNSEFDIIYKLIFDEQGRQYFDLDNFEKGMWRVKINWRTQDKEFYRESILVFG